LPHLIVRLPAYVRSENATAKPQRGAASKHRRWRDALEERRCLIPVSGFYVWQRIPDEKYQLPWLVRVRGVPLFAFAGLWEEVDDYDDPVETFTILTRRPNDLIAPIKKRRPVIVRPELYDAWLKDASPDALAPFPADLMEAFRVSTRVNEPKNDDPAVLEPLEPPANASSSTP
jgi:putative SOS response-associated peptidase YedK